MDVEGSPRRERAVVVGRAMPTLPGILVVGLLATAAGLMVGWSLAGGPGTGVPAAGPQRVAGSSATPAAPRTRAPLVQAAVIDPALSRAYADQAVPGAWLLCRSAETLTCENVVPLRLSPSAAFGASGGISGLVTATRQLAGGRFALVAALPYAVGVRFVVTPEAGSPDLVDVAAGGGIHYLDLGSLPSGRHTVLAEAELGPPAGGLVEALAIDVFE